ncbi:transcription-repair coupling factor [Puniceicoccaceae bacterium K14]|nr:transcription-repair coupling factor [Puniceicoccaceae bacterium K14]
MSDLPSILLPYQKNSERWIGVGNESSPAIIEEWIHKTRNSSLIVVVKNEREAEQLTSDLEYFHALARTPENRASIIHYPELPTHGESSSELFDASSDRIAALLQFQTKKKIVWVTTPQALAQETPLLSELAARQIALKQGQIYDFIQLIEDLDKLDYDSEGLCEAPGQYSKRGGLIDVYPVTANTPYRIDFFGDEIEAIKELDPVTQRSGKRIKSIDVSASPKLEMEHKVHGILDHLGDSINWCLLEPDDLVHAMDTASQDDLHSLGKFWVKLRDARQKRNDSWLTISDLDLGEEADHTTAFEAESLSFYRPIPDSSKLADERLADEQAARIRFLEQVKKWEVQNERILVILPNQSDEVRIREMLAEVKALKDLKVEFIEGDLNQGFRIRFRKNLGKLSWLSLDNSSGIVVITETELFGRRRNRKPPTSKKALVTQSQVDQLLDFAELVDGEFIVHLQHGIGIYRGITKVNLQGQEREVLSIEFDEEVILHIPLQESHLISRYVGLSKVRPRLGNLSTNRWAKTREAAEKSTLDLAAKLLEIQAKRDLRKGHPFEPDTQWQDEFEKSFPFTETPDQMTAILDTKSDMEKTKPMDRLICGDVGFGKTEIAIRAAFKAVMGGKQVAILVPTTVLAQQHFLNFRDRMASYPVVVELVSRLRKPAEIKKILQATKAGKVDILIGTHRIVSKDVSFKDLGIVIIDEEQRFGVKHKEVFKQWRETVDILTMSATPIPRTLYMALTGARELSVIETAPQQRKPIQTIVKGYDDKLVQEVVQREVARGGQVFYLHNRVQTIDATAQKLRTLLPNVSIGVGHGQMDEKKLERVMADFVDHRYQMLVCTTIIESGLDIPNCNTIIIEGADRFGLSQLYQLRGRVGRFKRQAYAYLLLHKHKRVVDVARKRLQAIRQHNQLGAGFRIAMRDLELRGAGNLLGSEQSGHIVGIGFELYCQLLKQSIARLKGEPHAQTIRANVRLDFIYQGEGEQENSGRKDNNFKLLQRLDTKEGECEPMLARIPATYLSETRLRIDLYRRLAMAESPKVIRQLSEDMIDRFGKYPREVKVLLKLSEVRCLAEQKGIVSVESQGTLLKCRINSGKRDDFIKNGSRFPRLKANNALKRLDEILIFLRNFVARTAK